MAYKTFVSSTFEDLKQHRAYVITALRKAGFFVDPMEDWTASTDEPKTFSQRRVIGCDLCVLLVAFRRGHVPQKQELSITQLEFIAACDEGIDVLIFLLDEQAPWPRRFDEMGKDTKLMAWRSELLERKGVSFFGLDPNSIEIAPALTRWLTNRRIGDEFNASLKTSELSSAKSSDPEDELWLLVRNSEKIEDFENFLLGFPMGKFAKVVEVRLNQLLRERNEVNRKISYFINSCRELGFKKGAECEQCGNKVFIELPGPLQKLLDEINLPPRNKQILHVNGGTECAKYKRIQTMPAILPELTNEECEYITTTFYR